MHPRPERKISKALRQAVFHFRKVSANIVTLSTDACTPCNGRGGRNDSPRGALGGEARFDTFAVEGEIPGPVLLLLLLLLLLRLLLPSFIAGEGISRRGTFLYCR